jgi:cytochrome c biogenesis protein
MLIDRRFPGKTSMTIQKKNSILSLFASVQLALFLLFLLAATSIIGTLIPQNNPLSFYIEKYGQKTAQLFQLLDIQDMYNSWWFLGLLALFALNLIVCSSERIPQVIRTLRRDGLAVPPDQLVKFSLQREVVLPVHLEAAIEQVAALLKARRWPARQAEKEAGRFFFAERGGWTRFGVYVVHCSILIILTGAVVGSSEVARKLLHDPQFAFKGSIMLPEGESTNHILAFKSGEHLELGFSLRCDAFAIEYYPNGMPKTYRSRVTIIDGNLPMQTAAIEVNQPLTYKGITFYQSSYQPYQTYRVSLKKQATGVATSATITAAKQMDWPEGGASYGIINRESQGEVTRRLKIWFTDNQGDPSIFWVNINQEATIERPSGTYLLNIRQLYATGLQATKDPGVWLVYGGCLLMLVGLYIAFFLSHRKIYIFIRPEENSSRIFFAGEANKNKVGFESIFSELINELKK